MPYFSNNKFSDYEINLLLAYCAICGLLAISPYYFLTWLVENITVWLYLALIIFLRLRYFRFSNMALFFIFLACCLHTIGGHFSFQAVPGGEHLTFWGPEGRNNFDRFGHFVCGLQAYPLIEFIVERKIVNSLFAAFLFSILATEGIAAIYELIEWLDVIIAEKRFGEIYLGVQGDQWDAQADMLNCLAGSLVACTIFTGKKIIIERKKKAQSPDGSH